MPTDTQNVALRRAINRGYIALDNARAVIRDDAPASIRRLWGQLDHNAATSPVLRELLRDKITQKYQSVGGYSSSLGLPIDPAMPLRANGDTSYVEFRGGTIETTTFGDPIAYEERRVKVVWTGFECQVRQESEDEVYGTVGAIKTGDGALRITHFPEGAAYWTLGQSGNRVVLPNVMVYEGPPADVVIASTLIEHDSGDIDGASKKSHSCFLKRRNRSVEWPVSLPRRSDPIRAGSTT